MPTHGLTWHVLHGRGGCVTWCCGADVHCPLTRASGLPGRGPDASGEVFGILTAVARVSGQPACSLRRRQILQHHPVPAGPGDSVDVRGFLHGSQMGMGTPGSQLQALAQHAQSAYDADGGQTAPPGTPLHKNGEGNCGRAASVCSCFIAPMPGSESGGRQGCP